ncbi:carboxymuconolactone decarboxylase family protein [Streptomyces pathocidini]|uniref:Carboxymuconolactone decarboxylase family protein n=1 Tax=Streptomyces pathocidini TaxID=1650571 RepID=A0ABW7UNW2_9ACTN|nr:carboxymuconolactone decarboxylase family protein [Streptomyces pathocidini]
MTDRLAKGRGKFEEIYGPGSSEGLLDWQDGLGKDLARLGIEFNFGDIYSRPGLTLAEREMATLAALTMLGGVDAQLRGHTRGGLNAGLTPTQILETVIHTVQYAGFPRALNAIKVVTETMKELGVDIPDALGPGTAGPDSYGPSTPGPGALGPSTPGPDPYDSSTPGANSPCPDSYGPSRPVPGTGGMAV